MHFPTPFESICPKNAEKIGKKKKNGRSHEAQLSSKSCPWGVAFCFLFGFLEVFVSLGRWPKPRENQIKQKNKTADPMKLSMECGTLVFLLCLVFSSFFRFSQRDPPQRVLKCFVFFFFVCLLDFFWFTPRGPPQRVLKYCFFFGVLLYFSDLGDKEWGKMSVSIFFSFPCFFLWFWSFFMRRPHIQYYIIWCLNIRLTINKTGHVHTP